MPGWYMVRFLRLDNRTAGHLGRRLEYGIQRYLVISDRQSVLYSLDLGTPGYRYPVRLQDIDPNEHVAAHTGHQVNFSTYCNFLSGFGGKAEW